MPFDERLFRALALVVVATAAACSSAADDSSSAGTLAAGPTTSTPAPAGTTSAGTTSDDAATDSSPQPAETTTTTSSPESTTSTTVVAAAETVLPENRGDGVTVAILDRGIDWRHPDFINPDGTTRIRWILDMTGHSWCDPTNAEPVEISAEEINAALASDGDVGHRDAVGHGTATAGMAAGNGSALAGAPFRGVAPEADLVIVKMSSEGAAARGSVAAEQAFNGCVDDALDWLDTKLDELGQPAVALWNAGTQWGPIDGTSATSRKIAALFGPDTPGRIWVAATGDEGSLPNHAGGTYAPDQPLEIRFEKKLDGSSYPTAWYSGEGPAQITVELDDGTVVGPVGPASSGQQHGVNVIQYAPGTEFYPWQSTSGDTAVWMHLEGPATGGILRFESLGASGTVDVYGDLVGSEYLTSSIDFLDNLVPGRINDVAATDGAIGVAVHVARHTYEDLDGRTQDLSAEGRTGELWLKSSGGPTRDGRLGVDISAPGQNAPASVAQDSAWAASRANLPAEGEGWYVRFGGTSAAAPMVAGTVALMLELDPELTAAEVEQILHDTAVTDEFTGEVPNDDWGYGKLDIIAAVAAAGS